MTRSTESSLSELLAGLAERTPTPGAGCATAWTGALAAGLLEMTAGYADDAEAKARAYVLRRELFENADRELDAYKPVLAAMRLPDQAKRERELREALSSASETPLAVVRAASEVAELGARVTQRSTSALRGDAAASVLLAEASAQAAARLVEVNLSDQPEDPRLAEVAQLVEHAGQARDRVLNDGG